MKQNNPLIAVSRCLLGENVRYDGESKPMPQLINELQKYFNIIGICPEVEIGLTVPRPPVQLVRVDGIIKALGVQNTSLDITDRLNLYAREFIEKNNGISGFVLKARSPSCGVGTTPILSESAPGNGVFADAIAQLLPGIPLVNETGLIEAKDLASFVARVENYKVKV